MGFRSGTRPFAVAAALALGLMLGGCFTQNYQRGYVLADGALEQIPLGAPQEQVLISLGTPSTVATVSGEVFYYISARTEQTSFLPEKVGRPARGRGLFRQEPPRASASRTTACRTARFSTTSAAPRRRADRNCPTSPTSSRFSAASRLAVPPADLCSRCPRAAVNQQTTVAASNASPIQSNGPPARRRDRARRTAPRGRNRTARRQFRSGSRISSSALRDANY